MFRTQEIGIMIRIRINDIRHAISKCMQQDLHNKTKKA